MADITALKQQASDLRKKGAFQEAVKQFRILWEEHRDQCNEWDGWGYAFSLRKIGETSLACQVGKEVHQQWPDFNYNRSNLAWCIYETEIKKDPEEIKQNESDFFKAVNNIIKLVDQDKYSPLSLTIYKVVDYLDKSKNVYPAEAIINWLDKLIPEKLSLQRGQGESRNGRSLEYASDAEKWYSKKIKALYKMGRYQECIELSQKAFDRIPDFHYQSVKWVKRNVALSYYELGQYEEGIKWLSQIINDRTEGHIHFEMALLLSRNGKTKDALKHAAIAALEPKELGYKWEIYFEIGKILLDQGEIDLAKEHLTLAYKVRLENEWSIPEDLQSFLEKASVDISEEIDTHKLEWKLREYWQSLQVDDLEKMTGTIKNMLREGNSGFISGKDGKDYYFQVKNFKGNARQLQPGREVEFYIRPTDQPGKRDTALNLELI